MPEMLCGTTDEDGTTYEGPAELVCYYWDAVCYNGIPDLDYMCKSLAYDVPADIYELDFDLWDVCCELSSECEYFEEVSFGY
jgi:hypothetical protein